MKQRVIQKPNPCLLPLRRDKYERKLLCFWAETGYEGERLAKDEELTRTTEIAQGFTDKVALGLDQASSRGGGPLPPGVSEEDSSDESMRDDDDDDDIASEDESDSRGRRPSAANRGSKTGKKKGKKSSGKRERSFDVEIPGEAGLLIQNAMCATSNCPSVVTCTVC